tara:strand:+ start:113515 stop:114861 length:1347 start_codon:yes stop_codon:yes gene_type:complete
MAKHILVLLFSFVGLLSTAQISTNSPYSSQGLGDTRFYGNAYLSALGGASVATFDSSQVNLFNPSSYSLTASQLPLFSLGVTHQEKRFQSGGSESSGRFSGITHMSLVVPFAKRLGIAFGLKPFSRTGYEVNDYTLVDGDSIFYDFKGEGAVQEFLLGFSGTIIDKRKHQLTVGINGKHYFGGISNVRRTFQNTNFGETGGQEERSMRASSFGFEAGLNYHWQPNTRNRFVIGGTFRPEQSLNFRQSTSRIYYTSFSNTSSYDTILAPNPADGGITLPENMDVGFSYVFTPDSLRRNSKLPMLMFTGQYTSTAWSNYIEVFEGNINDPSFVDASSIRLGLEYSPHRKSADRSAYVNFLDKFRYRVGAYQTSTQYRVNGTQLVDRGVTAGLGIPIVLNRAVSSVNFSFNYGSMGDADIQGVVQENYFGFNFGINIAPSYDRWFRKYKLD